MHGRLSPAERRARAHLASSTRFLGSDHPDTLRNRRTYWLAKAERLRAEADALEAKAVAS